MVESTDIAEHADAEDGEGDEYECEYETHPYWQREEAYAVVRRAELAAGRVVKQLQLQTQ